MNLPLSQIYPHCSKLLNLVKDINQRDLVRCEQALWNEVTRIRTLKEPSIFSYLIGYYHTLFFQISKLSHIDDLFRYNVLIRLGDLNRYIEDVENAEYYYSNARNLFPSYGHAYNQLGLLTKSTDCYKCCYYYARAAKADTKPLTSIADSNLRIATNEYNCEVLNHVLNFDRCLSDRDYDENNLKLPETAAQWFYAMVVAIYADNIQSIAKLFLNVLNENFSIHRVTTMHGNIRATIFYCDRDNYILLAGLDILLDWLKLGSQGKVLSMLISNELRQVKNYLQKTITSYQSDLNIRHDEVVEAIDPMDTIPSSSIGATNTSNSASDDSCLTSVTETSERAKDKQLALPHDYILRGFSPLASLHQELDFVSTLSYKEFGELIPQSLTTHSNDQKFIKSNQLIQFLERLKTKMNTLEPILRRRTRNIALEGILSNMNASRNY